jgi:hypothetical protein
MHQLPMNVYIDTVAEQKQDRGFIYVMNNEGLHEGSKYKLNKNAP